MNKIFSIILFILINTCVFSQTVRSFSNDFLNIGIGAKHLALGKSVSSSVNGVEAAYWNPAGIVTAKSVEIAGMHNSLFAGIGNYDYIGAAIPIEKERLTFGISVIRLGVDNILNTTNLIDGNGNINFNRITTFNTADLAAIITIGKQFKKIPNLRLGANAKIIRRNIGDFAVGNGFGFDLGAQYKWKGFNLGLTIRDITTTFTAWNVDDAVYDRIANAQTLTDGNNEKPESIEITLPKFQFGVSKDFNFNEKYNLLASVDLHGNFRNTNDIFSSSIVSFTPSAGLQLGYKNVAFLRTGVGNFQKETDFNQETTTTFEPNIGIGFVYKKIELDYALTNVGASSGVNYSNIFSIKFHLNEIK